MVFSSFLFLFAFLPIAVGVNALLPRKWSNAFLFAISIFFYACAEDRLVVLLLLSILWNFFFARLINGRIGDDGVMRKVLLSLGIAGNIALLVYFKYAAFLIGSLGVSEWFDAEAIAKIALPIGVSFFTFQGISYLLDTYRKEVHVQASLLDVGLYISLFPQLVAGPIVKYNEIAAQIKKRKPTRQMAVSGALKFIRGFVKKVLFANTFARIADPVFELPAEELTTHMAWFGLLSYTLQIYFDFSGYSDMAIGLLRIMGFPIPENFKHPYAAKGIRHFWRKWHISLSTWFRDYLYIPLGGSKVAEWRVFFNLAFVFLITGLWHGANFTFVVWGVIHGVFIILERIFKQFFDHVPAVVAHCYTWIVVCLAWVFFRSPDIGSGWFYFKTLFNGQMEGNTYALIHANYFVVVLMVLGVLVVFPLRYRLELALALKLPSTHYVFRYTLYFGAFIFCITELAVAGHSPFIYFKF